MESVLRQFSATEPAETDVLTGLGIDWTLLILQIVAFVILVWALKKWVYPIFERILNERQAKIDASTKAADEAQEAADSAEASVKQLMKKARRDAADIVSTAKSEASAMVAAAEDKAKTRTEVMLQTAQEDITKELDKARKELHNEMVDLVIQATEKVVAGQAGKIDRKVVNDAIGQGGK